MDYLRIYQIINLIKIIFDLRTKLRPTSTLRGWANTTQIKFHMAAGRHLNKDYTT